MNRKFVQILCLSSFTSIGLVGSNCMSAFNPAQAYQACLDGHGCSAFNTYSNQAFQVV